ncbi:MAG: STAS domain-containing protein [Coriobacteriia bacterium]|nr:STAS domain-containing protein [Coriobacteriia bacterium]
MSVTMDLQQGDEAWVLTVSGDLDYSECAGFRLHIDRILRGMPEAAIIDLSGVDYLDSSGLGLLLSLSREYTAAGGRLVVVSNETVDSILELTRLTGIFSIAPDADGALETLRATRPH